MKTSMLHDMLAVTAHIRKGAKARLGLLSREGAYFTIRTEGQLPADAEQETGLLTIDLSRCLAPAQSYAVGVDPTLMRKAAKALPGDFEPSPAAGVLRCGGGVEVSCEEVPPELPELDHPVYRLHAGILLCALKRV